MKKLTRDDINAMLKEEIEIIVSRKIFEQSRPKIKRMREEMIAEGANRRKLDENFLSLLSGMGQRVAGLGLSDFLPVGGSENLFGDMSQGMRVAIEQSILEAMVKKLGLDPYSGFGLTLKNTFEQVLKKYTNKEMSSILSDDATCKSISYDISKEVLQIIEESEKERLLGFAMKAILGELGANFQTSKITKPIYQNIRERFSEAFDNIFDEEAIARDLSKIICDNFNLDNALAFIGDQVQDSVGSAFSEFANAFDGFKKEYID